MKMELKTVIYIDINTQTKFTISDEKTLHQTLSGLWSQIYKLKHSHPIFCLEHRLVGTIDGCRVQSVPDTGKKLSIYVADNCETKDGKVFVSNGIDGRKDINISNCYTVINSAGKQLYPPLEKNQETALDKFIREAYNTKYTITKQQNTK